MFHWDQFLDHFCFWTFILVPSFRWYSLLMIQQLWSLAFRWYSLLMTQQLWCLAFRWYSLLMIQQLWSPAFRWYSLLMTQQLWSLAFRWYSLLMTQQLWSLALFWDMFYFIVYNSISIVKNKPCKFNICVNLYSINLSI